MTLTQPIADLYDLYDAVEYKVDTSEYWCPPCACIPARPCSECTETAHCDKYSG